LFEKRKGREERKVKEFNDVYGSELVKGLEGRKERYHAELQHKNIFAIELTNSK
jgi:hypothetical protein